jgi:hypothetical protein
MNRHTVGNPSNRIDPTTVRGWGVDADPTNNPTHPYRNRSRDDHSGSWTRPARQHVGVEILQSIEHKQRPAVVGTSTPPAGLSGALRRLAFRKSESNLLHWMLLLGADRINMVEGLACDLGTARIPNIPGEMGMRAGWQYNKRGVVLKTVFAVGLVAIAAAALSQPRPRRPRRR